MKFEIKFAEKGNYSLEQVRKSGWFSMENGIIYLLDDEPVFDECIGDFSSSFEDLANDMLKEGVQAIDLNNIAAGSNLEISSWDKDIISIDFYRHTKIVRIIELPKKDFVIAVLRFLRSILSLLDEVKGYVPDYPDRLKSQIKQIEEKYGVKTC